MKNIQIFAALVALTFILLVSVVIRYTSAADVTATAEITNTAPTVDTLRVSDKAYTADLYTSSGILPAIGADLVVHINGQITDLNGEADIASSTLALVFHRTTSTNTCTADKNDCYRITTCDTDFTTGDDTQISYNCEVPLAYWIDATDAASDYASDTWTSYLTVNDIASAQGTLSATIEVNSLLALNIPTVIDYSTRSLGEQSSSTTNIETILAQRGNTKADVEVLGTVMNCNVLGSLSIAAQKWSLTDTGFASSTTLTDALVATARNVSLRTDDINELTANLYWNIGIPVSGVKGLCTGANTILIIAQPTIVAEGTITQYGTVAYDDGPYNEAGTTMNMGGYYRTVTIGTQTWFKDNLNAGVMLASGGTNPANNGTIEKWCYNDSATNCNNEGGLYHWDEVMKYLETAGVQGICPLGWHIPTDNEYKILEVFLGMTQAQADGVGWRGTDQGSQLKIGGSTGFDGVTAGFRGTNGVYYENGLNTKLWSSSVASASAWSRFLYSSRTTVLRDTNTQTNGYSVRCLKD